MKLLLTSLSIALASTTLAAAAPGAAEPIAVAVSAEAEAPSAERLALARQFMALASPADTLMEDFREGFVVVAGLSGDEGETPVAKAALNRLMVRLEPTLRRTMPAVIEASAQVYAREFTADELRHLVAFAGTPAGAHYLRRAELIDMDPLITEAQMELGEEIAPVMEDFRKELCAEKAEQRIAAGDTEAKCPLSEPDTAQG